MNESKNPAGENTEIQNRYLIDQLCDAFEEDWQEGRRPELNEYLSRVPSHLRHSLLIELINLDWDWLKRIGDEVDLDTYISRFPEDIDTIREQFEKFHSSGNQFTNAGTLDVSREQLDQETNDTQKYPFSQSNSELASPISGSIIGGYEILESIGKGGMGVVYRARQLNLRRIVALKMIKPGEFDDPAYIKRFQAEASAAAQLDHPGIVQVYDVGEDAGRHYFSMAYVDGPNLAQLVAERPLTNRKAAVITKAITEAIAVAHAHGLIHRDLKPANVLMEVNGQPKITDFGLAKSIKTESDLTATGQILGTPSYMPPEQATGSISDVAEPADIYSIGAILYCLLTGNPPFQSANPFDTLKQVQEQEPVPPRQLNPQISEDLETICLKCLEKDPAHRYSSAYELGQDLSRYINGEPIVARPVGLAGRTWRWCKRQPVVASLIVAIAASLMFAISGTVLYAMEADKRAKEAEANSAIIAEKELNRRQLLSNSYLERGWQTYSDGDIPAALRWHTEAFRLMMPDATKADVAIHRKRIGEVIRRSPIPQHQWLKGRVDWIEFPKGNNSMICVTRNGSIGVYDRDTMNKIIPSIQFPKLNNGEISCVAVSPDSSLLALSSLHEARIWNLATGQEVTPPLELIPSQHHNAIRFTADSKTFIVIYGTHAKAWHVDSGEPVESGEIDKLEFAERDRLVLRSDGNLRKLWDLSEYDVIWEWRGLARTFDISKDWQFLLVAHGADPAAVTLWDLSKGGSEVVRIEDKFLAGLGMIDAKFSPDATHFAIANSDLCYVQVFDVANGEAVTPKLIHPNSPLSLDFSPDGKFLLTACRDGQARIWDAKTGEMLRSGFTRDSSIQVGKFLPSGNAFVTGGWDGVVTRWSIPGESTATHRITTGLAPDAEELRSTNLHLLHFNPKGDKFLFHSSGMADFKLIDTKTAKCTSVSFPSKFVGQAKLREVWSPRFAWDPTSRWLAMITVRNYGEPKEIFVYDTNNLEAKPLHLTYDADAIDENTKRVTSMAFGSDGKSIIVSDTSGTIRSFSLPKLDLKSSYESGTNGYLLEAATTGDWLLGSVNYKSESQLFDLETLTPRSELMRFNRWHLSGNKQRMIAYSPDTEQPRIWELGKTFDKGARFAKSPDHWIINLNWDGTLCATSQGQTYDVRVWNVDRSELVTRRLKTGNDTLQWCNFASDDRSLGIVNQSGEARSYDLKTSQMVIPPTRHSKPSRGLRRQSHFAAFSSSGNELAIPGADNSIELWHFEPIDWPIDDLIDFAELVSGQTIDRTGGLVGIPEERWKKLNQELRKKHPEFFVTAQPKPFQ